MIFLPISQQDLFAIKEVSGKDPQGFFSDSTNDEWTSFQSSLEEAIHNKETDLPRTKPEAILPMSSKVSEQKQTAAFPEIEAERLSILQNTQRMQDGGVDNEEPQVQTTVPAPTSPFLWSSSKENNLIENAAAAVISITENGFLAPRTKASFDDSHTLSVSAVSVVQATNKDREAEASKPITKALILRDENPSQQAQLNVAPLILKMEDQPKQAPATETLPAKADRLIIRPEIFSSKAAVVPESAPAAAAKPHVASVKAAVMPEPVPAAAAKPDVNPLLKNKIIFTEAPQDKKMETLVRPERAAFVRPAVNADLPLRERPDLSQLNTSESQRLATSQKSTMEQPASDLRANDAIRDKAIAARQAVHFENSRQQTTPTNIQHPQNGNFAANATAPLPPEGEVKGPMQAAAFSMDKEGKSKQDDRQPRKSATATDSFGLSRSEATGGGGSFAKSGHVATQAGYAIQRVIESIETLRQSAHQGRIALSINLSNGETLKVSLRIMQHQVKAVFSNESESMRIALRENWEQLRKQVLEKGLDAQLPEFESERQEAGKNAFEEQRKQLAAQQEADAWLNKKTRTQQRQSKSVPIANALKAGEELAAAATLRRYA
jgi:hypothetical protein